MTINFLYHFKVHLGNNGPGVAFWTMQKVFGGEILFIYLFII